MDQPYDGSDPNRCNMLQKGRYCRNPAGKGTDHVGFGYCKKHRGMAPSLRKHAMKLKAMDEVRKRGLPIDVDPMTALVQEVQRAAGWVAFYEMKIRELCDEELAFGVVRVESDVREVAPVISPAAYGDDEGVSEGKRTARVVEAPGVSVWVTLAHKERRLLIEASKAAIACGITERMVKIAEEQSRMFVLGQTVILRRLGLDPQDRAVRAVVRDVMNMLATGDMKQLGTGEVIDV